MNLSKLPFDCLAEIFDLVGADGLLQLSCCSHAVADMVLKPNLVMRQLSGHGSLLLAGQSSKHLSTDTHSACRNLLRKQIDLENYEFETGPALEEAMSPKAVQTHFSRDHRFCAIVGPKTLEMWDHLADQLLFTEELEHQIPELEAKQHSRAFVYLEDSFIVIFRTHDGMSEFDFPKLHVEFINFSVSAVEAQSASRAPLLVLRHRCLVYGADDPERYWGWYHKASDQLRVLREPSGFVPPFRNSPFRPSEPGAIDHWNVSSILDQSAGPQFRLDGLAAFCCQGSAEKGWYIFISEQATCHDIAGAPVSMPQNHLDPDRPSRRRERGANLRRPPKPECTLIFVDLTEVNIFEDPYEGALEFDYQSIPRDRRWYMHVYDSVSNKAMGWPRGSECHFSGPDEQEMEYEIVDGVLRLSDGLHNCWEATRQNSVMSPLPRGSLQLSRAEEAEELAEEFGFFAF